MLPASSRKARRKLASAAHKLPASSPQAPCSGLIADVSPVFFVLRPPCKGDRHHSIVSYVFRHGLALAWCGPVWLCCAVEMLRPWPGVALALLWPWSCCGPSRSVDLGPSLRKFPAVSPHIPCKLQTGTPPAAPKLLVSSRRGLGKLPTN